MDLGLKDKVAVISGGSVGIGLAVAEGLAQEGVHLALCARNEERLKTRAQEISSKYGVKALGVRADVSKRTTSTGAKKSSAGLVAWIFSSQCRHGQQRDDRRRRTSASSSGICVMASVGWRAALPFSASRG